MPSAVYWPARWGGTGKSGRTRRMNRSLWILMRRARVALYFSCRRLATCAASMRACLPPGVEFHPFSLVQPPEEWERSLPRRPLFTPLSPEAGERGGGEGQGRHKDSRDREKDRDRGRPPHPRKAGSEGRKRLHRSPPLSLPEAFVLVQRR